METSNGLDWLEKSSQTERAKMVDALAQWFDDEGGLLSSHGQVSTNRATPQAAKVREFKMDRASFGAFPELVEIAEEGFLKRDQAVPAHFVEQSRLYQFFWLRLPIGLFPAAGWAFNRLEVQASLHVVGADHRQPRAVHILPKPEFEQLAQATVSLSASLAPSLELELKDDGALPSGKAAVSLSVAGNAGLSAGPIAYRAVRAKVETSAPGLDWVRWRLSDARLFQENTPELVLIAQVPRGATGLSMSCAMQARRYFRLFSAEIQDAVANLPSAIQAFFRGGLPTTPDEKTFDLSAALANN